MLHLCYAVILWIHSLLWSKVCCSCNIISQWKAPVSIDLYSLCWFVLGFCWNFNSMLCRFGQPIKVNWAYASGQREDTSGWYIVCLYMFIMDSDPLEAFGLVNYDRFILICRSLQHICWWSQSWGHWFNGWGDLKGSEMPTALSLQGFQARPRGMAVINWRHSARGWALKGRWSINGG